MGHTYTWAAVLTSPPFLFNITSFSYFFPIIWAHVHFATSIGGVPLCETFAKCALRFCLVTQLRAVVSKSSRSSYWTRCAQPPVPDLSKRVFVLPSLPQLFFILISSQYSSLLDHPLISFSSFGPLVGVLQYWANESCKLYTLFLFFAPFFISFAKYGVQHSDLLPIVVMSQFLEQITGNVSWHLTKPVSCVILSPMLLGAVVQNSLWNPSASLRSLRAALFSHEWMNEWMSSVATVPVPHWVLEMMHYSCLFVSKPGAPMCMLCTCVLFL